MLKLLHFPKYSSPSANNLCSCILKCLNLGKIIHLLKRHIFQDKSVYPVPCPTPCPTPTLSSDSESQEKTRETTLTKDAIVRSKNSTKSNTAATRINSKAQWHKERAQAEQCKTCGLKFSMKTDRKVIQEHANFHMRNRRKQ